MSFLNNLNDDQRETMVSLPYRVGLYVSMADETGGEEALQEEHKALESILAGMNAQMFSAENVQAIMNETLNRRADWPGWAGNLKAVPEECSRMVDLLRAHAGDKDLTAFQGYLMEIAEAVALAFRERSANMPPREALRVYWLYGVEKIRAHLSGGQAPSFEHFLNISALERKALNELATCLNTKYT